MAKLVLTTGESIVYQCFVDRPRLTIGREAHNQIVIDDAVVSREHAAILQVGNDHIVEDLGSANGTMVNGTIVPRRILQHGDVMDFGQFQLRYLNPKSEESELDRTMLIKALPRIPMPPAKPPAASSAEERAPTARVAKVRFPTGRVKVLAGPRAGRQVELDRVVATFGREGEQLSVITRRPQGFYVTHVDGSRYPQVNGESIGKESRPLTSGDVIDVAGERLEFVQD